MRSDKRKTTGENILDVIVPLHFPRLTESAVPVAIKEPQSQAPKVELPEAERAELHEMLALQKWTPWSRSLFSAANDSRGDATHLFILSEAEQEVYNHVSSAFVIGRSGTGKTGCALFKLLGLEEGYKNEAVRHRQLIVTKVRASTADSSVSA